MRGIIEIIILIIAIFIVTDIFEFTKALASTLMGDKLPKSQGRLTLNPIKHFEPIGFLLFVFTGMGWGKPVETSMVGYKSKRAGTLVTYITPIVVSLIFAGLIKIALVFLAVFFADVMWADYFMTFLGTLRHYFVIIAVFNLIPVYPLCGNRILRCFLSPNAQIRMSQNEKLYQTVFIFLWLLGLVSPVVNFVANALLNIV